MKKIYLLYTAILAICLASCTKPEAPEAPYFNIVPKNSDSTFVMGPKSTSLLEGNGLKVFIYSNQEWNLSILSESGQGEEQWVSIYPTEGKGCGRFYFNVSELSVPYPRKCTLFVKNSKGEKLFSTLFTQQGITPKLTVDNMMLSYGSAGGELTVNVTTNINWGVKILPVNLGEDVSWCSVGKKGDSSQGIICTPNGTDNKRSAIARFYMVEDEAALFVDVAISQLPVYSITNAELKTISEATKLSGLIEENIKIQGFVISDKNTLNIANNAEMFIQDGSGRGIIVKFSSPDDNVYELNDKVSVWLTGSVINTDTDGLLRITNISSSNISKNTTLSGNSATPIVVTDISTIGNYPSTLVVLKGVYFAAPVGTICNVGTWASTQYKPCAYGLTPLLDRNGNRATMRTLTTFTEKWKQILTGEEYDITGLVLKDGGEMMRIDGNATDLQRLKGESYTHTIRVRRNSDIALSGAASRYTPITYWVGINTVNTSFWSPQFGPGEFNICAGTTTCVAPSNTSRVSYLLIDASAGADNNNCHIGYSTNSVWDQTYGGYYYEVSTPTLGKSGDIYLSFIMGNYGTAARYWKIQYNVDGSWKDLNDGQFELWNSYSTGTKSDCDYTRLYAPQTFCFKIPDASEKDKVSVRLTTKGLPNKRSDGSASGVSNSSSTNLFYFIFTERK